MGSQKEGLNPLLATLLLYTLPIALAVMGGAFLGLSLTSLKFLALQSIVTAFGSIALYLELKKKPKEIVYEEAPDWDPVLTEAQEKLKQYETLESELKDEIAFRNDEMQKLVQERNLERDEKESLHEELMMQRNLFEEKLEEEQLKNQRLTETVSNLSALMDRKQEEIDKLGGKIHDLTFEIKTLVQIADMGGLVEEVKEKPMPLSHKNTHPVPVIEQADDAKKQLRRCLDIAQKITGSYHLGGYQSRFREMAFDNYALDLRRLCDSLRSEKGAAVIVYSRKENKLLFINNQVKTLLGHSPEKFVQDFESIVQEGMLEWKKAIGQLTSLSEAKTSLIMKNKNNEDIVLQCLLGMIPTGVFKNHVLGILHQ